MAIFRQEQQETRSISVVELQDGEIAEIVDVPVNPQLKGKLLQRYYDHLVLLGEPGELGWSDGAVKCDATFRVRLVRPGTLLRIEDRDD